MNKADKGRVIDGLMRFIVGGGSIATIMFAPGMATVLDKPTRMYFRKLDKRQQARELKQIVYYMKQRGLIKPTTDDYMHGLIVTQKGTRRLAKAEYESLSIGSTSVWDRKWRIILFDIPEQQRVNRRLLITKLKALGFQQLQRSVWVHPLACRSEVELVASHIGITKYLSYIEATGIDNEAALITRFNDIINTS